MTKEDFIFNLKRCGFTVHNGEIMYEENELIKCFEDVGAFEEQEPIKYWIDHNGHITPIQQPCEDAISREDAYKIVMMPDTPNGKHKGTLIRELPPVTVRQTGEWINDENHIPICSKCGYIPPYDRAIDDYEYSNYCPSCGCRMVEPQESEDKE